MSAMTRGRLSGQTLLRRCCKGYVVPSCCAVYLPGTRLRPFLQAKDVATAAVQRLGSFNRRTLDVLAARVYHYYSLAHERTGTLPTIRR